MPAKLLWKLPGVTLAAISLLLLSVPAFGLHFKDTFMDMLRYAGDLISGVLQLELIEAAIRKALAPFAIDFHPAKHWHISFALLWLLFASLARSVSVQGWVPFILTGLWGVTCALIAGSYAGLVPFGSPEWLNVHLAGMAAYFLAYQGSKRVRAITTASWIFGGFGIAQSLQMFGGVPPLVTLALLIFGTGVLLIIISAVLTTFVESAKRENFLNDELAYAGMDIVGAFGAVTALAIAGHYLL